MKTASVEDKHQGGNAEEQFTSYVCTHTGDDKQFVRG